MRQVAETDGNFAVSALRNRQLPEILASNCEVSPSKVILAGVAIRKLERFRRRHRVRSMKLL